MKITYTVPLAAAFSFFFFLSAFFSLFSAFLFFFSSFTAIKDKIHVIYIYNHTYMLPFSQYESGGTFFIGFIIEYLAKLNAIILIIYSSRPFNVCELQEFALRGSD